MGTAKAGELIEALDEYGDHVEVIAIHTDHDNDKETMYEIGSVDYIGGQIIVELVNKQ